LITKIIFIALNFPAPNIARAVSQPGIAWLFLYSSCLCLEKVDTIKLTEYTFYPLRQ